MLLSDARNRRLTFYWFLVVQLGCKLQFGLIYIITVTVLYAVLVFHYMCTTTFLAFNSFATRYSFLVQYDQSCRIVRSRFQAANQASLGFSNSSMGQIFFNEITINSPFFKDTLQHQMLPQSSCGCEQWTEDLSWGKSMPGELRVIVTVTTEVQ